MANISVTLALHVSKWNAIRKCSYAICPAATGHRILGSTLQSDGGMSTVYHHSEGKDKQDDRSASNAVRDGDSASHQLSREETGSDRNEDVQMGMRSHAKRPCEKRKHQGETEGR